MEGGPEWGATSLDDTTDPTSLAALPEGQLSLAAPSIQSAELRSPVKVKGNFCRIPSCGKALHRRYAIKCRLCPEHMGAQEILVAGSLQRFCQKCARLHPLTEFDGLRRTCRFRLHQHNCRQRMARNERKNKLTGVPSDDPTSSGATTTVPHLSSDTPPQMASPCILPNAPTMPLILEALLSDAMREMPKPKDVPESPLTAALRAASIPPAPLVSLEELIASAMGCRPPPPADQPPHQHRRPTLAPQQESPSRPLGFTPSPSSPSIFELLQGDLWASQEKFIAQTPLPAQNQLTESAASAASAEHHKLAGVTGVYQHPVDDPTVVEATLAELEEWLRRQPDGSPLLSALGPQSMPPVLTLPLN